MFLQVVALKSHDVSDQQLSTLGGHADEAGVEAVRTAWYGKGIKPQHFDGGREWNLIGEEEREREECARLIGGRDRYADSPAAQVDGFLSKGTVCRVGLRLNADGQEDGDAIKLAAFSPGWL